MIDFQYNNDISKENQKLFINQYSLGNIDKLYDIDIFNKLGLFSLKDNEFKEFNKNISNKLVVSVIKDTNFYNKIHLDITLFIEIFRKLEEELGAAQAALPAAAAAAPAAASTAPLTAPAAYLTDFFTNLITVTPSTGTPQPPPTYLLNLNKVYGKEKQLEFEFNLTKKYFELLSLINENINPNSIPELNNPS